MFKFVDSLQIRTCGGVESNQGIKAVHVVVATTIFGHRSLPRRTLLRWCTVVNSDGELRRLLQLGKMLSRRVSSPGCFLEGRRRRLSMEASVVLPIPASTCKRERSITGNSNLYSPIPSFGRSLASRRSSRACRRGFR
jgi:hypothetical protein